MPFTALLWRHHALETRLSHLEQEHLRTQHTLGRLVETICAFDEILATAFGLVLHRAQNPPSSSSQGGEL